MFSELCFIAPPDWDIAAVQDICHRVTSGGTPSRKVPEFYEGGTWPWVKTQELRDSWLRDSEEHITETAVSSSSAKVLPVNTVLIAMYGATVGQLGLLGRPMTCNQACCALIVDATKADYRFVFYQFLVSRRQLKQLATGAAQQNLSGELVKSLRFPFPPLAEQRAIAHILGTLDDKIELNRKMNSTLEEMARALFKSWFVDFDPVRARAEGRATGLPKEISDLFPSSFVDSELGEIPKGWKVGKLGDVALLTKKTVKPMDEPHKVWEHYSIPAFDEGKLPAIDLGEQIKSNKFAVSSDQVLVSKLNPQFPRIWLPDVQDSKAAICSTEFLPLTPIAPFSRSLLFELVKSDVIQTGIKDRLTGSTGSRQRAQHDDVLSIRIAIPSKQICLAASQVLEHTHGQTTNNIRFSRTLASLRDTLLPKLISGELRVEDAEKIVGKVG